ncbi:hypothetical protein [Haloferula sp. A504]|uniref:hypothetical protein n=1 Tax=Haloferula sp. A504 TaxID=3373601 RepID=UPI0031CB86E0|nr:hypothetical protein [Verrucomicrobiaceae bacterium E54]
MKSLAVFLIALFFQADVRAEGPLPPDAQQLVEQRDTAIARIDKIFVEQLKALQVDYTKKGDLEIANRIASIYLESDLESILLGINFSDSRTAGSSR